MVQIKIFPKDLIARVRHGSSGAWQQITGKEGVVADIDGGVESAAYKGPDRRRPSEIAIELHPDKHMILRDYLALDRTVMSNEQSVLSYLRTALAFAAGGAALLHISALTMWVVIGGVGLILSGVVITIIGFVQFYRVRKVLDRVKQMGLDHKDNPLIMDEEE